MSSIFIWKSLTPVLSQKTIRQYTGSNWFLEENGYDIISHMYIKQDMLYDDTYGAILIFNTVVMPCNWIGSEILEIVDVPYTLIKEDNYGKLEQLGEWTRCIIYKDCMHHNEFKNVLQWIQNESNAIQNTLPTINNYNKPIYNYKLRNKSYGK